MRNGKSIRSWITSKSTDGEKDNRKWASEILRVTFFSTASQRAYWLIWRSKLGCNRCNGWKFCSPASIWPGKNVCSKRCTCTVSQFQLHFVLNLSTLLISSGLLSAVLKEKKLDQLFESTERYSVLLTREKLLHYLRRSWFRYSQSGRPICCSTSITLVLPVQSLGLCPRHKTKDKLTCEPVFWCCT